MLYQFKFRISLMALLLTAFTAVFSQTPVSRGGASVLPIDVNMKAKNSLIIPYKADTGKLTTALGTNDSLGAVGAVTNGSAIDYWYRDTSAGAHKWTKFMKATGWPGNNSFYTDSNGVFTSGAPDFALVVDYAFIFNGGMTLIYNNGTAGVGATLSNAFNGALVIDGATMTQGKSVIVTNYNNAAGGVYWVDNPGDASHAWVLRRTNFGSTPSAMTSGVNFLIRSGTNFANTFWTQVVSTSPTVFGTSLITYNINLKTSSPTGFAASYSLGVLNALGAVVPSTGSFSVAVDPNAGNLFFPPFPTSQRGASTTVAQVRNNTDSAASNMPLEGYFNGQWRPWRSTFIGTVSANTTLDPGWETLVITSGTPAITLPSAGTVNRRVKYIIVNETGAGRTISSYLDFTGAGNTTIPANSSITVQSDGTNWYRVQ